MYYAEGPSIYRGDGGFESPRGGDGIASGTGGAAPAPAPAPTTTTAPTTVSSPSQPSYNPESPEFRSLPRNIQRLVESGQMGMLQAMKYSGSEAATGPVTSKTATPSADNAATRPMGGGPSRNIENQPGPSGSAPESRLSLGEALSGGRTGMETFSRSGTKGYQAFSGREFSPQLLRAEALNQNRGAALSVRDALNQGLVGRTLIGGGGGGGGTNQGLGFGRFRDDLLR